MDVEADWLCLEMSRATLHQAAITLKFEDPSPVGDKKALTSKESGGERLRELKKSREKLKKQRAARGDGAPREKGSAAGNPGRGRAGRPSALERRRMKKQAAAGSAGAGGGSAGAGGGRSRFGDSLPLRARKPKAGAGAEGEAGAGDANTDDADSDASTVEGAETPRTDDATVRKNIKDFAQSMITEPVSKNFSEFPFLALGSPGSLLFPRSMTRAQLEDLITRTSLGTAPSSRKGSGFYVPHTPFFANNDDSTNKPTSKQNTAGRVRMRLMRELDANAPIVSVDVGKKATKNDIDPEDVDAVKEVVRDNWFQKDGRVRTLADPIDGTRKMPFALATMGAITDTAKPAVFRTSHMQGHMGGTWQNLSKHRSQVIIRVGRLQFTHHELFDPEDTMSNELISLHAQYWPLVSSDIESHCLARVLSRGADLHVRRQEVVQYNLMDSRQGEELITATIDLFNAWSEYIAVFRSVRKLERSIYAAWRRLKAYREEVGVSRTSTKLSVRQMSSNVPSNAGWDRVILNMRLLEDVSNS